MKTAILLGGDQPEKRLLDQIILGNVRSQGNREFGGPEWVNLNSAAWEMLPFDTRKRTLGRPTFYYNVMLLLEDVERLLSKQEQEPKIDGKSERFPGRPSLKEAIRMKLRKRFEQKSECPRVGEEAHFLFDWVKAEYPGQPGLPGSAKVVENLISAEYRELKRKRTNP